MCSRFELNSPAREVAARFRLLAPLPNLPGPVVRPTDPALVITADGPRILRFGIALGGQKKPLLNARSESAGEQPRFRRLVGSRCLVPASAWIEWQDLGPARRKRMWRLKPAGEDIFALAGLVDGEAFVILTRAPAPDIAFIHHRMPVVLAPGWEPAWLDKDRAWADLAAAPAPGQIEAAPADGGQPPATAPQLPFS
jgi:putative SOS response-associated peptidase YedK